jgi:IS30 family transposase
MILGERSARVIRPFAVWCRCTVVLFRQSGAARCWHSHCLKGEDISRGIASGSSIRKIAQLLERAASTVSREVVRHGGRPEYRGSEADQQAWKSALRPKPCLLAIQEKLQEIVASKLLLEWSPEQICGWLKTQYPQDESMRVSHETIYRSLFIQARGALKREVVSMGRRNTQLEPTLH